MPHHHAKGGGSWISFRSLRIRNLNVIKAVATLDAKPRLDLDAPHPPGFLLEFSDPPDDREKLRRLRISKANKGNTPWNKGRKHTPGTFYSFLFFSFLFFSSNFHFLSFHVTSRDFAENQRKNKARNAES